MTHTPCSFDIERFLSGQFTSQEETAFEEHLVHCEPCRHLLSQAAADDRSWEKAKHYLNPNQEPAITIRNVISPREQAVPVETLVDHNTESLIHQTLKLLAPTDDPQMLGRIGPYEVSGIIGAGGMGIVLKGWDKPLNRVVAIKLMSPHLASSGVAKARFLREAQAAAGIVHPNVIDIYGVAEHESIPYLVMPYVRGHSLQKRVQEQGALPTEDVIRIGLQIASGLAAAHAQGIIHRDIKPANILVGDGIDRIVITDFGLARTVDDASLTRSGTVAGTPQYMSPEQARGERIDERSDLFSLGSVLYFLCTGHSPFRSETLYGILHRIGTIDVRDIREVQPSTPAWLQNLVRRLHSLRPEDRFDSAAKVAQLLEKCLAHCQHPLKHELPDELLHTTVRAKPLDHRNQTSFRGVVLWSLPLLASTAVLTWIYWPRNNAPSAATPDTITSPEASSRDNDDSIAPIETAQSTSTSTAKAQDKTETATRANGPRYRFETGKSAGYLLTLVGAEPDNATRHVHGVILIKPFAISEQRMELAVSTYLETINPSSTTVNTTGYESLTAMIAIDTSGKRLEQPRELKLPYELGSPLQYVLPELDLISIPQFGSGSRKVTLRGNPGGEYLFDVDAGQIVSFQWDSWWPTTAGPTTEKTAYHLETTQLSDAEIQEWLELESNSTQYRRAPIELSDRELDNCTADLNHHRRVVFWLRRLDQNIIRAYSDELISALQDLTQHTHPLYRSLAQRLIEKIPQERQNPFQEIE
jgi:serine/threonine protein kinase